MKIFYQTIRWKNSKEYIIVFKAIKNSSIEETKKECIEFLNEGGFEDCDLIFNDLTYNIKKNEANI